MDEQSKMSEYASTGLDDLHTVNILICYLLYRLKRPIEPEQLYDIAVNNEIINYFTYQESISYLLKNNSVKEETIDGKNLYILTEKGISGAKTLRTFVKKSYRDKIVVAALKYFARIKYQNEVKIDYIPLDRGYYVHCRCIDVKDDLMDLKLYAPDKAQAEIIGKNIMKNPLGFYSRVLNMTLNNKEEDFDPNDL